MDLLFTLLVIGAFLGLLYFLSYMKKVQRKSYNSRVLTALALGIVLGLVIQLVFGTDSAVTSNSLVFMSIFGDGYITLLKMLVIPLIFVAMTTAIMNSDSEKSIAKIAPKIIAVLMVTVAIAAVIGILASVLFPIDGSQLVNAAGSGQDVVDRASNLSDKADNFETSTYADYILNVIPSNIFYMLSGQTQTATLSTVLFSMFLGYAVLQVKKRKPEEVKPFVDVLNASKEVVLSMVREVLKLTPFAILALMGSFFATSTVESFLSLAWFLVASYVALGVMYVVHLLFVKIHGLSVKQYAKKTWPVLLFGFGSRSSMAALPMNIETQTSALGVDDETASMAASFGTSIGQNGCAGIYPAMLAVLALHIYGGTLSVGFIIELIFVVAISSFGIAGVGGGATFAAVAVLSIMGLDVTIAAILVSIEPLIDMARTAINISDSMLAGVIVAKRNKTLDVDVYNKEISLDIQG